MALDARSQSVAKVSVKVSGGRWEAVSLRSEMLHLRRRRSGARHDAAMPVSARGQYGV
jgi:hypothetical protein